MPNTRCAINVAAPRLFFDPFRRVLELLPRPPARRADPLPGIAVDPDVAREAKLALDRMLSVR